MCGLAYREDSEIGKPAEVVVAAETAKRVAGTREAALDGSAGVYRLKSTVEDAKGEGLGGGIVPIWHRRSIGRGAPQRVSGIFELPS